MDKFLLLLWLGGYHRRGITVFLGQEFVWVSFYYDGGKGSVVGKYLL